jgi:hypothetical protein
MGADPEPIRSRSGRRLFHSRLKGFYPGCGEPLAGATLVEVEGRPDSTLFSTPHCFMGFTCPATLSSRACAPGPAFFSRPTVLVLLTLVRRSHASPINGVVGCRSCTYDRHYTCSLLACIYLLPLPGIFSANAWHTCTQQYTYHGRIMSARRFSWEQTPSDGS